MKISAMIFAVGLMAMPTHAHAQAFGIDLGSNIREIGGKLNDSIPFYYDITPPIPYAEFEQYSAITDGSGKICQISGIGKTHENDRDGRSAKRAFRTLYLALSSKYGSAMVSPPEASTDPLFSYKLDNETTFYEAEWSLERPIYGFSEIELEIDTLSSSQTYVVLRYRAPDFMECAMRRAAATARGL